MRVREGTSPLLISVPHAGTEISDDIIGRMYAHAVELPDTDWFVDRLYAWAVEEGASMLVTPWSRYVIDLNRPPDDTPMYDKPGTGLVPQETFDGEAIYRPGCEPGTDEIEQRVETYWRPYHRLLAGHLARIRERHGFAVLFDAHSIRSEIPRLFEGELPHLNLGSNDGASADPELLAEIWDLLRSSQFEAVRDARFKGGHITRHYGRPREGVHALQLEIAQRAYMIENPPRWSPEHAEPLIRLLRRIVSRLQEWRPGSIPETPADDHD